MSYESIDVAARRLKVTVDQIRYARKKERIKWRREGGRITYETKSYQPLRKVPEGAVSVAEYAEIVCKPASWVYAQITAQRIEVVRDGPNVYVVYSTEEAD